MERDPVSHIRLWCPRPFRARSPNKPRSVARGDKPRSVTGGDPAALAFTGVAEETEPLGSGGSEGDPVSEDTPVDGVWPEDGQMLQDVWYVIRPGNTREKVAFFCGAPGLLRPSAVKVKVKVKVKGEWGSDCTQAKRRRRCCSYTAPGRAPPGLSDADLLSVAQMVALVERRTAVTLQGLASQGPDACLPPPSPSPSPSAREGEQESWGVAEAVAHFEARRRLQGEGDQVSIAFRVSSADPHSHSKPAGHATCVFLSRGGGAGQRAGKGTIACDLYQLLGCPPRDPPEPCGERPPPEGSSTPPGPALPQDQGTGEEGRERVTGFQVEVVATGAETATPDPCSDPPPGQLFFLQPPRPEEAELPVPDPDPAPDPSLCRRVSHHFLEIRVQIQRLLEPRRCLLLLPDHVLVSVLSLLPTRSLAALKCTCRALGFLIEAYCVRATDSLWTRDPLYREDPCKQCRRRYGRGDVSLCRWHPKPYHHDLPYGRSYWMCCRRTDKDTPGCRLGLHDNNWVEPRSRREDGR